MKKDINIPEVTDVGIAIVKELDNQSNKWVWNVYLLNFKQVELVNILITSKGYGVINDEKKKTTTLRYFFKKINPFSHQLIEPIMEDVFALSNEYFLTFYIDGVIYDKKFVFVAESIKEENLTTIDIMNKKGVLIR